MRLSGTINGVNYLVIGLHTRVDGSGYDLSFIDQDKNNKNGKVVGTVFVPMQQAIILGKGMLGQITENDIEDAGLDRK